MLGRNQNAVTCNLSDMWRVGVVEREKQGRGFLYRLVKQDGA